MERLKFAISKARDASAQLQLEQARAGANRAEPGLAATATAQAQPVRRLWPLGTLVLLGLVAVSALWVMKSGLVAAPMPIGEKADPSPPLQTTAYAPSPAAEAVNPVNPETPAVVASDAAPDASDNPPVPPDEQVKAAVDAWRKAWSTRNMTAYLAAYSKSFEPPADLSRADWIASRHRNVGGRKSIDVQIKALQILALDDRNARVSFLQDYTSGSIHEKEQTKTLDLVLDPDDRWRIVGEWQGDPPELPVRQGG
jgi:hypothetical protein